VSLASFLALIARSLRDADIPFMLTGSSGLDPAWSRW
jgi:hypothetical protein